MNKTKTALIAGLITASIAPQAFAKCPDKNTYDTIKILTDNYGKVNVQQLIDYINQAFGYSFKFELPKTTDIPKTTEAPAEEAPEATAAPEATRTPQATAAPTAVPTPAPTAKPTAKPTAAPTAKPTAVPAATNASAIEKEVFDLVNQVRTENGLSALTWADDLANVARAHSRDMINRNFFAHNNPDGQSPFDRLKANGISYRVAAENIAYGQKTPEAVMNAWMNSSGHRANILNASVKELGVGAATNANGTIYWTQEFVAR